MKKLLLLLLITPLFFACKHNTASGTQGPVTACSTSSDCENNTNGKTMCRNGECVDPSLMNERACAGDKVVNGFGDELEICANGCADGACIPRPTPACSTDIDCASNTDGKTVCYNNECVNPSLLNVRACSADGTNLVNGFGDVILNCANGCSEGACR